MTCEIGQHDIKINTDANFECKFCGIPFLFMENLYSRSLHLKYIKDHLKKKYGKYFWHYEWYKLQATQSIVRKLLHRLPPKYAREMKLDRDKLYSYEDFSKGLEDTYYDNDEN